MPTIPTEAEGSKLQGHPLNIYIWKYDFTTVSAAVNGKSGFKKKGFMWLQFQVTVHHWEEVKPTGTWNSYSYHTHKQEQRNDTIYV